MHVIRPSRTFINIIESKRHSKAKLLSAAMISGPQNDLRHTGHIGYDGAVFGDVSFIGDNYDKLPVKVSSTGKHTVDLSVKRFSNQTSEEWPMLIPFLKLIRIKTLF